MGDGASPLTSIKHAGLPWELGWWKPTHVGHEQPALPGGATNRWSAENWADVAIAALLGAEEFGFATAPLVALGWIMMRKCHLNTCPVGIATQDPELRKSSGASRTRGELLLHDRQGARQIMAELGFRTITEMVGRPIA